MEDRFCRDSMYPTKHIKFFPLEVNLKLYDNFGGPSDEQITGIRLIFEYARFSDLHACQRMIQEAACRGGCNVGVDEYKDQEDFDFVFDRSEIFLGRGEGETKVFVIISPSMEVRSYFDSCTATIRIIYTSDLDQDPNQLPVGETYYQQLLRLAVNWVQAIDLGYTQCSVRVAVSCHNHVEALRREGFEIQVTVPYSVNMFGRGLTTDYWVMKKLDEPSKHVKRTREAVTALVDRLYPSNAVFEEKYQKAGLPQISFFPQDYVFANGTRVTIRDARKEEDVTLFNIFKSSAENADGYDSNEYASLSYFRVCKLMSNYSIVYEETSTGRIIGCQFFGDSAFTRSARTRMQISSLAISREFQNMGFGREMLFLDVVISRQLGYRAIINDTLENNKQMDRIMRLVYGERIRKIGRIPNGAYSSQRGWEDLLPRFFSFDSFDLRDLADIAQQTVHDYQKKIRNKQRCENNTSKL